jgi:hypothetical protein
VPGKDDKREFAVYPNCGMLEGTLCTIARDESNDGVPAKARGGDGDAGGKER